MGDGCRFQPLIFQGESAAALAADVFWIFVAPKPWLMAQSTYPPARNSRPYDSGPYENPLDHWFPLRPDIKPGVP